MSDSDHPTEWLANGPTGFGWGRTQDDALVNMFAHMDPWSDDLEELVIDTVEHRGSASVSLRGWEVDEFVSGERLTISALAAEDLRGKLAIAYGTFERVLEGTEREDLE